MRIVFMGTPEFAVASLSALHAAGHEIVGVYSQPDRPKGRGHKVQLTPVKEFALSHDFLVRQPLGFKEPGVIEELQTLAPDCIVVVAYGRILPKTVLAIPTYGCINVHGSLLPKYRGAAPIQWALLQGETYTGVTTMFMSEGMDTGDMLLQEKTAIGEDETAATLFDRLKIIGADLLVKTIANLEAGTLSPRAQCEAAVTYAPLLTKEMSVIQWQRPAREIRNQIRGMNGASTCLSGKK